jgi:PAS domain S-box-containing protein
MKMPQPLPPTVECGDGEARASGSHLLPIVAACFSVAGMAALVWALDSTPARIAVLLATAVVGLASAEWNTRVRLRRLVGQAQALLDEDTAFPERAAPSERVNQLLALQAPLGEQMRREQNLLRAEAQRRMRAEEHLQETGERYTLAVGNASDGMWEWHTGSGSAFFSPCWKSMLGHAEHEIGECIDEWHSRIHPDDRERVLQALQAHLDGHTPRFEDEHRLRHKDGGWRWVLARAAALRHASGRAYRVVGLNLDVSARRQAQEVLVELADGLQGLRGEAAYGALVQRFATILDMPEAFLCRCCDEPATRVRMLAHWRRDGLAPCAEYDLAGTPCCEVIASAQPLVVRNAAHERWPSERPAGVESYLGLPCIDTRGVVLGHIACRGRQPMTGELPHEAILQLFAVRASVDMEREALDRLCANASR